MRKLFFLLSLLFVASTLSCSKDRSFVLGEDDSRHALQSLIDQCSEAGGGVVVVPEGVHQMDGPLELKSHVRLHLCDSATLLFTSDPDAYLPVVLTRWEGTELYGRSSMIHAQDQTDFIITGEGSATIDANGGEMARWGMPGGKADFEENVHGTHGETPETPDVNLCARWVMTSRPLLIVSSARVPTCVLVPSNSIIARR